MEHELSDVLDVLQAYRIEPGVDDATYLEVDQPVRLETIRGVGVVSES